MPFFSSPAGQLVLASSGRRPSSWLSALAVGTALAAAACYVLFGPDDAEARSQRRRRQQLRKRLKGCPRGLVNTGNDCFMNAVLQALAASPSLSDWLQQQAREEEDGADGDVDACAKQQMRSVLSALARTLRIINGQDEYKGDVYSAEELLRAIRSHGWKIDTDEQDAHEMFDVLLTSLEEELAKRHRDEPISLGSSLPKPDDDGDVNEEDVFSSSSAKSAAEPTSSAEATASASASPCKRSRPARLSRAGSGVLLKSGVDAADAGCSAATDQRSRRRRSAVPFCGTLTSKVTWSDGRSKSPVKSSNFNNITLSLPRLPPNYSPLLPSQPVTLETLLQMYVSRELIEHEKEGKTVLLLKQQTFGRLPKCLCLHVQRTAFEQGCARKRTDFVKFPLVLDMSEYVYANQVMLEQRLRSVGEEAGVGEVRGKKGETATTDGDTEPEKKCQDASSSKESDANRKDDVEKEPGDMSKEEAVSSDQDKSDKDKASDKSVQDEALRSDTPSEEKKSLGSDPEKPCELEQDAKKKNSLIYDLRSAVFHIGHINSGHYITYRLGSGSQSWFCVSDDKVEEAQLDQIMRAQQAYMLFYERRE